MKLLFPALICALTTVQADDNWPQWRGPLMTGESPTATPPVEWSETKNIRWKTAIPGKGHSTPAVWGNRVFVTAAEPFGEKVTPFYSGAPGEHDNDPISQKHRFLVLCLDRRTGKILWEKTLLETLPHAAGHTTGSLASASPSTDGERVYAFFGTHGLYSLTLEGEIVWKKGFGEMQSKHGHGEGSTPALHGDTLAVNWDHEAGSFVVALDKKTGEEKWRVARDEATSWASPIVYEHRGVPQLIVSGTKRIRGYDLRTGEVLWECGGLSQNVVASPVAADGIVVAGSSYEKKAMLAIRLEGAKGDLTEGDHVIWHRTSRTPYVPSPLLVDNAIYFLSHYQGVLTRLEFHTGDEPTGPFRLGNLRDIYASPVAADGRLYITDRTGVTLVLSTAREPAFLAANQLADRLSASPALAGKDIFLRGEKFLYCLAESAK